MIKIIVAEDEPAAMHYMLTLLKKHENIEVTATVEDGIEALEALKSHPADILITDIQMPRLSGIELAKRVRAEYPDMLTLIVSGYSDFEFAKEAIRAGVVEYILKPFTPAQFDEVLAKMNNQVKNKRRSECEVWLRQAIAGTTANRVFPGHHNEPLLFGVLLTCETQIPGGEFVYPSMAPDELSAVYIHNKSEICFVYPYHGNVDVFALAETLSSGTAFYTTTYIVAKPNDGKAVLYDMLKAVKRMAVLGKTSVFEFSTAYKNEHPISDKERGIIKNLNYEIANADIEKVKTSLVDLFALWEKEEKNIAHVEVTLTRLIQLMADNAPPGHLLTSREIAEGIPAICRESKNYPDILGKIWSFCGELYKSIERMTESGQLADSIVTYIREHLNENLSAQSICAVFNISNSQLYRVFRKYVKMSVVEYITELRIAEAKRMFKDSPDMQVKDVAALLGFSDQFYFSKVFRAATGLSPSEYRNG